MKKKILSLLLAFGLTFSLAACGSNASNKVNDNNEQSKQEQTSNGELQPEEGAELVVWESPGAEADFIKFAAEKFEEKYGVPVAYEEVQHSDAKGKLQQDGPAGVGADVFISPHNDVGELAASGLVLPNTIAEERIKNSFMDAAITGTSYDDVLYGYPLAIETYALFYNKDIFPEPPKTFDEIIEKGKEFTNPDENKYVLLWEAPNAYYVVSWLFGHDGYVFGKNGTDKDDLGIDSKGSVEGLEDMLRLKEVVPMAADDLNYNVMTGLFYEGKVGATINGPWAIEETKKNGINFGIAPLPLLSNGKHPNSFSGIRTAFVSSYSNYPNAAQLFADFISSDEMLVERFKMTSQIPPVKTLMDSDEIKNNEYVAPILEQAQYAVPMPGIPEMGSVWEPLKAGAAAAWNGDLSAEEALKNAGKTIRDAIEAQQE